MPTDSCVQWESKVKILDNNASVARVADIVDFLHVLTVTLILRPFVFRTGLFAPL